MKNPTHSLREKNLVLQLMQELQIKSKTVMSWGLQKNKEGIFVPFVLSEGNFLTIVFYLNV